VRRNFLDKVYHIVQALGKLRDVLAVDGGDEGGVQLGYDTVGDFIAVVLYVFDMPNP